MQDPQHVAPSGGPAVRLVDPPVDVQPVDRYRLVRPTSRGPRPISNSRGRRVNVDGTPLVTRSSCVPGRRRGMRWLNDNFVHAYAMLWPRSEVELAERLEHALLTIDSKPMFEELAEHKTLMRAFRHGVVGVESLLEKRAMDAASAFSSMSVRALLNTMYTRIDKRIRAIVLKEARRILSNGDGEFVDETDVIEAAALRGSFIMDLEMLLQRFMDGQLEMDLRAVNAAYDVAVRTDDDCAADPTPSRGAMTLVSTAFLLALADRLHVEHSRNSEGRPIRQLFIAFKDGLCRLQAVALCQFYGLHVQSKDDGDATKRLRISAPVFAASGIDSTYPDGKRHPLAQVAAARIRLRAALHEPNDRGRTMERDAAVDAPDTPVATSRGASADKSRHSLSRGRSSASRTRLSTPPKPSAAADDADVADMDAIVLEDYESVELPCIPLFLLHVRAITAE